MSGDFKELDFKLFGLPAEKNGAVRLEVLGDKLEIIAKGLKAADRFQNKSKSLNFLVTDAKVGSFAARVAEHQVSTKSTVRASGIDYFYGCVQNVQNNGKFPVGTPKKVAKAVVEITDGVGEKFDSGNLKVEGCEVINITPYLAMRARAAFAERFEVPEVGLFAGSEIDVFDGTLKEVDLRDSTTAKAWLVLTGTAKQIPCVWNSVDGDAFRYVLDKRARVEGVARYDGSMRLPAQLDIRSVVPFEQGSPLTRWKGKFKFPEDPAGGLEGEW